jgi:hypothetical protein
MVVPNIFVMFGVCGDGLPFSRAAAQWRMDMPRVLNHKRDGLPRGAVYIGRQVRRYSLPCSKWANTFRLRIDASREDREEVIRQYERHLVDSGLINGVHAKSTRKPRSARPPNPSPNDRHLLNLTHTIPNFAARDFRQYAPGIAPGSRRTAY